MLIGITGPSCSGKHCVAEYLVSRHNFVELVIQRSANDGFKADRSSSSSLSSSPSSNEYLKPTQGPIHFQTVDDVLEFVTDTWSRNFVLIITRPAEWFVLNKRPFALLVAVDAPVGLRFRRWRRDGRGEDPERFMDLDGRRMFSHDDSEPVTTVCETEEDIQIDEAVCALSRTTISTVTTLTTTTTMNGSTVSASTASTNLYGLMKSAQVHVTNSDDSLSALYSTLDSLELTNIERLRPSWDAYFMELCDLAAKRSNCMKRRVGCILVKDRRVISTGYNGTPRGVPNCSEGGCPRCNSNSRCGTGLDVCLCLHAEENALLEAGRERVDSGEVILYCNTCPCLGCAKKIVQVGVKQVVYSQAYGMDGMTADLFKTAGVKLRQFSHLNSMA
ncbi:cytidine deaminase-like protein [Gaertneriomyces semiglobifer]|nr:cytidine deaminase-like protein [Gaertneriomyces semiglobifer]